MKPTTVDVAGMVTPKRATILQVGQVTIAEFAEVQDTVLPLTRPLVILPHTHPIQAIEFM